MCRRATRGFLKQARIPLEEEDVVEEIEAQRTEIEEGSDQAPILKGQFCMERVGWADKLGCV